MHFSSLSGQFFPNVHFVSVFSFFINLFSGFLVQIKNKSVGIKSMSTVFILPGLWPNGLKKEESGRTAKIHATPPHFLLHSSTAMIQPQKKTRSSHAMIILNLGGKLEQKLSKRGDFHGLSIKTKLLKCCQL